MRIKPSILSNPFLFLALACGLSWLFEIPAIFIDSAKNAFLVQLLRYLGGLALPVAAITAVYLTYDAQGRTDYWIRLVDFKRIGWRWYAFIFLTVPLLTAFAAFTDIVQGGDGGRFEVSASFFTQPLILLLFAIFILLFGPLPEEMTWRGYALDRLQEKRNALNSSLILGAVWTLWHLPLFFIEGTYQYNLGIGTVGFWLFMADKIPQSIIMTWIYNNNRRSTLSAVLFHFMINFTGELFELTEKAEIYYIIFWILAAFPVAIILTGKKRTRRVSNKTKYID